MNDVNAELIRYLLKQGRNTASSSTLMWLFLTFPLLYENWQNIFVWSAATFCFFFDMYALRYRYMPDSFFEENVEGTIRRYAVLCNIYGLYWGCLIGYIYLKPDYEQLHITATLVLAFSTLGGFSVWLLHRFAGKLYLILLLTPSIIVLCSHNTVADYTTAALLVLSTISLLKIGDARAEAFVETLQNQIKLGEKAHAYKTISQQDPLTQLNNRRFFDMNFEKAVLESKKLKQPISLLVIDIDYFKKINDNYGHDAGDSCLKFAADLLKQQVRAPTDNLFRFGGEEFVVILADTNKESAERVADRMLQAFRENSLEYKNQKLPMTISIGVSSLLFEDDSSDNSHKDLFRHADEALYRAKSLGRDRLVSGDRF